MVVIIVRGINAHSQGSASVASCDTSVLGSGLRRKWDPKQNGRLKVYVLLEEHEIIDCQMKKATSCPLSPTCRHSILADPTTLAFCHLFVRLLETGGSHQAEITKHKLPNRNCQDDLSS